MATSEALIQPSEEVNRYIYEEGGENFNKHLSTHQFQSLQFVAYKCLDINKNQVMNQEEVNHFTDLYSLIQRRHQEAAPFVICEMLKGIGRSMTNLEKKLKAVTYKVDIDEEYPHLKRLLALCCVVSVMNDDEYTRFRDTSCRFLSNPPHPDHIILRFDLLDLLETNHQLTEANLFAWLEESGCRRCCYVELEKFYNVRKYYWRLCYCYSIFVFTLSLVGAIILVSILYISLTSYTDVNIKDPYNTSHTIGLNTTILLGCYDPQIIDQVDISNLDIIDSAVVYKTRGDRINVYNKTLTNTSIFNSTNYFRSPVPVSYFDRYEPIYTAKDGGFMTYSIRLINRNATRPTCAMRMIVLKSEQDYLSYTNAARDPNDPLPASYYAKACVADNGTYPFTFQLEPNSFYYFVVEIVENVIINVTASGSLSVYLHPASDQDNHCTLSASDPNPCPIDINDRRSRENDNQVCIFGESRWGQEGKVRLYITFMSRRVYDAKYWGSSIVVGVITLIIMIMLLVTVSICICHVVKRKKRIRKAARRSNKAKDLRVV